MTNERQRDLAMEHAWKYFEIHAAQRMSIFNFFVIMLGLVSAGLAATIQGSKRFSAIGIIIGLVLMLLSFIFWKLDQRTSFLVKHAENVLISAEQQSFPQNHRLFCNEPEITKQKSKLPAFSRMWTYGEAFRFIFATAAIIGLAGSVISIMRVAGISTWN